MEFSQQHIAAFRRYERNHYSFDGLSAADVDALAEDVGFKKAIASWRAQSLAECARKAEEQVRAQSATAATSDAADFSEQLANSVADAIATATAPLQVRIQKLEQQIAGLRVDADELKAWRGTNPGLRYRRTWEAGTSYNVGDVVTRSGAMWTCTANGTKSCPGVDHDSWALSVKAGRDGKDVR